jgi:zinc D-Ala-D-Ala carboxypeptidase
MNNFKEEEFICKCGCGLLNYDKESADMLQIARTFSDTPYVINSACRCVKHNANVSGSDTSSHLADEKPSTAWDIKATNSVTRFKILKGLILAGFTRIGIANSFIHADSDKTKSPGVTWLY